MFFWPIRNYFKLNKFMNIKFFHNSLLWTVGFKISYYNLNPKQKILADEFAKRLKILDGIN